MKHSNGLKFCAILLFLTNFCIGQQKNRSPSYTVGIEAILPTGTISSSNKTGVGGSLKVAFPVTRTYDVTLSPEYLFIPGKTFGGGGKTRNINSFSMLGGIRHHLAKNFYAELQMGYSWFYYERIGVLRTAFGAFTVAGNISYTLTKHLDISVRYEDALFEGADLCNFALRLGYRF